MMFGGFVYAKVCSREKVNTLGRYVDPEECKDGI
jgi:hypothetical protein